MADREQAVAWLTEFLAPDDVVLVKASRAAGLETVAAALLAAPDTQGRGAGTDAPEARR